MICTLFVCPCLARHSPQGKNDSSFQFEPLSNRIISRNPGHSTGRLHHQRRAIEHWGPNSKEQGVLLNGFPGMRVLLTLHSFDASASVRRQGYKLPGRYGEISELPRAAPAKQPVEPSGHTTT